MSEDDDFVTAFAHVESQLREAQEKVLKANGLTWKGYADLKDKALALVTSEITPTQYGKVQVTETPIYEHQNSIKIGSKKRIRLIREE